MNNNWFLNIILVLSKQVLTVSFGVLTPLGGLLGGFAIINTLKIAKLILVNYIKICKIGSITFFF